VDNVLGVATVNNIARNVDAEWSTYWSGVTAGLEQSAQWLFDGALATSRQYSGLGDFLITRAAELSGKLQLLAEGVGNPIERGALLESAQRISEYVETTRAGGADALEAAGRTAATASRHALAGALGKVAGPAVDGWQYIHDFHSALTEGEWASFGATAAGIGAGAALGAVLGGYAIAGVAALSAVVAVPAGVAISVIFAASFLGAWGGSKLGETIFSGWSQLSELLFPQFQAASSSRPAIIPRDPLAIDLDADGIETTGIGLSPITFDHNADGVRTGTGWVKSDDAWLVIDRNGNGSIDSGRELFGLDYVKANIQFATSGLDALADLDSNRDGRFTASDTSFSQVQLWQDINQDGISQSHELHSLAEKGIASIALSGTAVNRAQGDGNTVLTTVAVTRVDGSTTH
jgi:hypothetical protein